MVTESTTHRYDGLEIKDLLEAREAYHFHLLNLPNVVATAIGRYLIRESDPDIDDPGKATAKPRPAKRTLVNSAVKPWSRPCVLVFVEDFPDDMDKFRKEKPEGFIPPILYLPDHRVVPTCVICATAEPTKCRAITHDDLDGNILGGGYPVLSDVQGQKRVGTIGCLVTDGHSVFALTNRHVAGPEGQESYMRYRGKRYRVGESVEPSVRTIAFDDAYPAWPGAYTHVNLDAGLIKVDRIDDWTAQVYGLGPLGELRDYHATTLTLDVIDNEVRAFGGVSGPLAGRIKGLFYRYRSRAGYEFVSDFLIGPAEGKTTVPTRHGDSGTLWSFEDHDEKMEKAGKKPEKSVCYRPFSMQWGATTLRDDAGQEHMQFALTSNLSTVLHELDVEIVRDWNAGLPETWGKMGHYHIAAKACDVVADDKLFRLLQANRDLIGLTDADRRSRSFPKGSDPFVALADVPDLIWKRPGMARAHEKPTHFADMDEAGQGPLFAGKTLFDLFNEDPTSLNTATWIAFYESLGMTPSKQGSLPFRVRQFYAKMVNFLQNEQVTHFVAAAGILAHYVADACQPLHSSHLHDGAAGIAEEKGVHSQFEDKMLNKFNDEIMDAVDAQLDNTMIANSFTGAQTASEVTIDLMAFVHGHLPPREIIDEYVAAKETSNTNDALFAAVGDRAIDCLVEGILYCAEIWESAWLEGGGPGIPESKIKKQSEAGLRQKYVRESFVPSFFLNEY